MRRLAKFAPLHYGWQMDLLDRITVEPGKCGGRPCLRGTRLRVMDVLELLAAGASHEEILADYAFLEPEDIQAALLYSARQADHAVFKAA
jgi:uncharacterized protein (DUF433 family)